MRKEIKNKSIVWSFEAKSNLELIFDHISKNFSFDLAVQKIEVVVNEIDSLSAHPRKGKISEHFNEMRELVVDGNTVYYRNGEDEIVIASIRPRRTEANS